MSSKKFTKYIIYIYLLFVLCVNLLDVINAQSDISLLLPIQPHHIRDLEIFDTFYSPTSAEIISIALSSNGDLLAISDKNQNISIWDIQEHRIIALFDVARYQYNIKFDMNGKYIGTHSRNELNIWNLSEFTLVNTINADYITSFDFSSDSESLVYGSWYNEIVIWNIRNNFEQGRLASENPVLDVKFHPLNAYIAFSTYGDNDSWGIPTVKLWDLIESKTVFTTTDLLSINSIDFGENGNVIAFGSSAGTLSLWKWYANIPPIKLAKLDRPIEFVDYNSVTDVLLSIDNEGSIKFWNTETQEEIESHISNQLVNAATFSHQGNILAVSFGNYVDLLGYYEKINIIAIIFLNYY